MKVELIKDDKNHTCGWTITAENTQEMLTLGSIRNLEFWGTVEDHIEYNGMTTDPKDDNYVTSVKYGTKKYKKEQLDKLVRSIETEIKEEQNDTN